MRRITATVGSGYFIQDARGDGDPALGLQLGAASKLEAARAEAALANTAATIPNLERRYRETESDAVREEPQDDEYGDDGLLARVRQHRKSHGAVLDVHAPVLGGPVALTAVEVGAPAVNGCVSVGER